MTTDPIPAAVDILAVAGCIHWLKDLERMARDKGEEDDASQFAAGRAVLERAVEIHDGEVAYE